MYIYLKQCEILQKFNETDKTVNFSDFPLIFSGNGPNWTKTMQTQTHFSPFFLPCLYKCTLIRLNLGYLPGCFKKPVVLKSSSYGCQDAVHEMHCGMFPVSNIFESGIEREVGKVAETGKPMFNIWLAPNKKKGPETGFTLDLGCVKKAEGVRLKNTHNRQYRDRATKKFKLLGSPTSAEGPWQTLLEANLEDSRQQRPPPIKQLMFENPQNVRFIRFELLEFYGMGGGLQYFEVLAKDDAGMWN